MPASLFFCCDLAPLNHHCVVFPRPPGLRSAFPFFSSGKRNSFPGRLHPPSNARRHISFPLCLCPPAGPARPSSPPPFPQNWCSVTPCCPLPLAFGLDSKVLLSFLWTTQQAVGSTGLLDCLSLIVENHPTVWLLGKPPQLPSFPGQSSVYKFILAFSRRTGSPLFFFFSPSNVVKPDKCALFT